MIEVLKQMVEALEWCHGGEPIGTAEAIKAGKQAIAELESQEPVAWQCLGSAHFRKKIPKNADITAWNPLYHYPPKLEQKIVAWGVFEGNLHDMFFTQEEAQEMAKLKGSHAEVRPLYTHPPQPAKPIPCANHCEATAFEIVIKNLQGEIERLKAPQRTWVGLMRGVRVEGDTVVISVHYGNDAARQVCGALIEEMNT